MPDERMKRMWLARSFVAYVLWGTVMAAAIAISYGQAGIARGAFLLLASGVVLALYLGWAGRILARIASPSTKTAGRLNLLAYLMYAGFLVLLVVSIYPLVSLDMSIAARGITRAIVVVSFAGSGILGLVMLAAFVAWHRSLSRIASGRA